MFLIDLGEGGWEVCLGLSPFTKMSAVSRNSTEFSVVYNVIIRSQCILSRGTDALHSYWSIVWELFRLLPLRSVYNHSLHPPPPLPPANYFGFDIFNITNSIDACLLGVVAIYVDFGYFSWFDHPVFVRKCRIADNLLNR